MTQASQIAAVQFSTTFLVSVAWDQFTKVWATRNFIVRLNSGVSLSWLHGFNQMMVIGILILFLVVIGWMWRKTWVKYAAWSGLFFGGAISNIIDRLLYGGVRDWFNIPGLGIKNNLADWLVCISLAVILFQLLSEKKTKL